MFLAKSKWVIAEKVEQNGFPNNTTFGYINRGGEIYKDEKAVPFVIKLFELLSKGHYSLSAVGDILYDLGLRNPHKGTYFGKNCHLKLLKE